MRAVGRIVGVGGIKGRGSTTEDVAGCIISTEVVNYYIVVCVGGIGSIRRVESRWVKRLRVKHCGWSWSEWLWLLRLLVW